MRSLVSQPLGDDGGPARRELIEHRHLEVTEDDHRCRARDRRRRHDEQIRVAPDRPCSTLRPERGPLLDPEAVLLVDDRDAEGGEGDVVGQEGVGADHNVNRAVCEPLDGPSPLSRRRGGGEQAHLERSRSTESVGRRDHKVTEHRSKRGVVLISEHLGGHHQCRLAPTLDAGEHGGGCHQRLASTDVTLEQAMHRQGTREVEEDLAEDPPLGGRGLEGERVEESTDEGGQRTSISIGLRRLDRVPDAEGISLEQGPPEHEGQLEAKQLIERQATTRRRNLLHRFRRVDALVGRGAIGEVEAIEDLLRKRLREATCSLERFGHEPTQLPARHAALGGLGVDGDDPTGLARSLVATGDPDQEVHDGVGHLRPAPVLLELAEQQHLCAGCQLATSPGLVEEGDRHRTCPVIDVDRDHGAALAGSTLRHLGHRRQDDRLVTDSELGKIGLARPIDVAPGIVPEQIEDRGDAERLERLEPFGTDALEDPDLDGGEPRQGAPLSATSGRGWLGPAHSIPKR